ncbi:synovial apoptosis inhibitor 1, synoviolin [Seminavis robusta]|uniref:Synovial apoptosis inhibitor 1, synoviolin n=1 Tax=Seminavis robusta TaxID=568900 RepID=A0A9N8DU94_9STRA|nr:synovial apoptosis inhibitor 1, synoviolin [Seminavis robusta]|eukprot:Sro284_g107920.1 synovial apoptosis inhibitor 1, synoviolin (269) ;mRNA; r:34966-35772
MPFIYSPSKPAAETTTAEEASDGTTATSSTNGIKTYTTVSFTTAAPIISAESATIASHTLTTTGISPSSLVAEVALSVTGVVLLGLMIMLCVQRVQRRRHARAFADAQQQEEERKRHLRTQTIQEKLQLVEWTSAEATAAEEDCNASSTDSTDDEEEPDLEAGVVIAEEEQDEHVCCICIEAFQDKEMVSISNHPDCKHKFHKQCIENWLQRQEGCPTCRRPYLDAHLEEEEKPQPEPSDTDSDDSTTTTTTSQHNQYHHDQDQDMHA